MIQQNEHAAHPPSSRLPESNCRLLMLEGCHHHPEHIRQAFSSLALENEIEVKAADCATEIGLRARIDTPFGIIILD